MNSRLSAAAGFLSLTFAGSAAANDTTANLAAGGLVFEKTGAIEMMSEDLFVSMERITVRYEFRNISGAPVTTTVAFPMPEIRIDPYGGDVAIPSDDPQNPLAFETTIDGERIPMSLEQKVFAEDVHVTATMAALGLPLAPQSKAARVALDALPPEAKARIVADGIAVEESYDAGKGWEDHLAPNWTLRATYHWEQTFPPGEIVVVEHGYEPSVGGSVGTILGQEWADDAEVAHLRRRYCIEDNFKRAVERRTQRLAPGSIAFQERWLDYILVTGANWARPIGTFRLVVDKGAPENLVSFCASGVEKIGPTTFQVEKHDYLPTDDLRVLILVPADG
jgi:hypothetical protein